MHRDAMHGSGEKNNRERAVVAAAVNGLPDVESVGVPEAASANTRPPENLRKCGNCCCIHLPKKLLCPAEKLFCRKCGIIGHIAVMCRGEKQAAGVDEEVSSVVVVASGKATQQSSIAAMVCGTLGQGEKVVMQIVPDTSVRGWLEADECPWHYTLTGVWWEESA